MEYDIYKDIKGESVVKRISDAAIQAISIHANFFLQDADFTYIRVYGSEEQPLLLSRYASDRLILMEFARQPLFLKVKVLKKKNATINLPISISRYMCQTWVEATHMREEQQQYNFFREAAARNYDPKGIIAHFYDTAFHRPIAFPDKSLGSEEKYRNIRDKGEIA